LKKSHTGTVAASILAGFLVIYFAFPVVVLIPMCAWYHGQRVPYSIREKSYVLMNPAIMLGERVARYHELISAEDRYIENAFGINRGMVVEFY